MDLVAFAILFPGVLCVMGCMICCRYLLVERQQIEMIYVSLPAQPEVQPSAPPEDPII
jgi:hypothetical protein